MKQKELITKILKSVSKVATLLDKPPFEVSKAEFLANTELEVSDWQFRKL